MKYIIILVLSWAFLNAHDRIVTLSPSLSEIVFALGKGDDIVANTMYSDYPKAAQKIKKVGGYASISIEKILEVNPSVVITQDYDRILIKKLKLLNLNVISYKTNSLESIKYTISSLGKYFNKEKESNNIILNIQNELESLKGIIKDKKILIVISPRKNLNNQIYVAGNNLYFEDIIKYSQNKNAYFSESLAQPIVNMEKIINMNPDIVVILAPLLHNNQKELELVKQTWLNLPINASIKKNIYSIDESYAGIPSQRIIYFIKDFKKILKHARNK